MYYAYKKQKGVATEDIVPKVPLTQDKWAFSYWKVG